MDEGFGDALGILALAVHAQGNRGQASVQNPALVGLENVAEETAAGAKLLVELRVNAEDDAGQQV